MSLEKVDITNTTAELSDVQEQWFLDKERNVWCLEDILYTMKATTPKFQRLSIYVPGPYMRAPGVVCESGAVGGYTALTAPVIFENNSAGYMQMPHTYLGGPRDESKKYLDAGMVYVTCGNRGSESRDANGKLCGKSPWNLVDLKTAIRFLRHNKKSLPGKTDVVISVGWSAGGAMSSLLSLTGDHPDYLPYLEQNGAFMEESDAVYAAQIYCPIVDLDHADLAYEWMFHEDKESEDCPAGPSEVMTPFKEAVSSILKREYIAYFNGLNVKNPETSEQLVLGEDGRSGSAYDYLMKKLNESGTKYLTKLSEGALPVSYSVDAYLKGEYSVLKPAPAPGPKDEDGPKGGDLGHFAGEGVALGGPIPKDAPDLVKELPTLGDLMARPPKGTPKMPPFEMEMMEVPGDDKSAWLTWDGKQATIKSLDAYIFGHRRRMKPCTSFDTFTMDSGENRVFGECCDEKHFKHFDTYLPDVLEELKDAFPQEYAQYAEAFQEVKEDQAQLACKRLYNPFGYVTQGDKAKQARYNRIRVGAQDADTSFSVSMTLACLMAQNGLEADYALVWDMPHSEADYEGEVVSWIQSITQ